MVSEEWMPYPFSFAKRHMYSSGEKEKLRNNDRILRQSTLNKTNGLQSTKKCYNFICIVKKLHKKRWRGELYGMVNS